MPSGDVGGSNVLITKNIAELFSSKGGFIVSLFKVWTCGQGSCAKRQRAARPDRGTRRGSAPEPFLHHNANFRDNSCHFQHPLTPFLTTLAPRRPRDREPQVLDSCSRMPRNLRDSLKIRRLLCFELNAHIVVPVSVLRVPQGGRSLPWMSWSRACSS